MPIEVRPTGPLEQTEDRTSCYPSAADFNPPLLKEGVAAERNDDDSKNFLPIDILQPSEPVE
jgi:hypothetical protein